MVLQFREPAYNVERLRVNTRVSQNSKEGCSTSWENGTNNKSSGPCATCTLLLTSNWQKLPRDLVSPIRTSITGPTSTKYLNAFDTSIQDSSHNDEGAGPLSNIEKYETFVSPLKYNMLYFAIVLGVKLYLNYIHVTSASWWPSETGRPKISHLETTEFWPFLSPQLIVAAKQQETLHGLGVRWKNSLGREKRPEINGRWWRREAMDSLEKIFRYLKC